MDFVCVLQRFHPNIFLLTHPRTKCAVSGVMKILSETRGGINKSCSIFWTFLSQLTTRIAYTCARNSSIRAYPQHPPTSPSFLGFTRLLWLHGRTQGLHPLKDSSSLAFNGLGVTFTSHKLTSSCTQFSNLWSKNPEPSPAQHSETVCALSWGKHLRFRFMEIRYGGGISNDKSFKLVIPVPLGMLILKSKSLSSRWYRATSCRRARSSSDRLWMGTGCSRTLWPNMVAHVWSPWHDERGALVMTVKGMWRLRNMDSAGH